jgi:hypothetical protein
MRSENSVVENLSKEERVLEIIAKAGMPVSVDYVAFHLKTSWPQARALLFKLASQRKIKAVKTTKSWIFMLPRKRRLRQEALTP